MAFWTGGYRPKLISGDLAQGEDEMKSLTPLQAFFEALTESGLAFDEYGVCTYLHDQAGRRVPMTEAVIASARKARRTYIMAEDLRAGLAAAKSRGAEAESTLQCVEGSGDTAPAPHPSAILPAWAVPRPEKYSVN